MKLLLTCIFLNAALLLSAQEQWFRVGSIVPAPQLVLNKVIDFNKSQPNYSQLSLQEQEVYYYTNLARAYPNYFWDSVVNPILTAFPHLKGKYAKSLKADLDKIDSLPLLILQPKLIETAKNHANDMASAKGDYFSHSSTNGQTFQNRMRAAGINAYTAENISMGQQAIILSIVLLFLDIDIPNLGHRKALLSSQYTQMGIGVSYKNTQQFYIVQDLSSIFY